MAYNDAAVDHAHLRYRHKLLDNVGLVVGIAEVDLIVMSEEEWRDRPESLSKSWSVHRRDGMVMATRLRLPDGLGDVRHARALAVDDRSRGGADSAAGF